MMIDIVFYDQYAVFTMEDQSIRVPRDFARALAAMPGWTESSSAEILDSFWTLLKNDIRRYRFAEYGGPNA